MSSAVVSIRRLHLREKLFRIDRLNARERILHQQRLIESMREARSKFEENVQNLEGGIKSSHADRAGETIPAGQLATVSRNIAFCRLLQQAAAREIERLQLAEETADRQKSKLSEELQRCERRLEICREQRLMRTGSLIAGIQHCTDERE